MKVNEFSKKVGIPASKIRYYDRLGLIKGSRKENNYRDFENEDVLEVYQTQLLRSYGIGLDELRVQKNADIEGVGEFLEENIDRTIRKIRKQELMLIRLRTMKSFHELFYDNLACIHNRFLSSHYRIDTFGKDVCTKDEELDDIRTLADNMPYSFVSVHVTKESLMSGKNDLDVRLGVGILKEISDTLGLSLSNVKLYDNGNIIEQLLEVKDPFSIKREDLYPLISKMEEMNLPYTDLFGRVYCSYMKDGCLVHGLGLATFIPTNKM